MVLQRKQGQGVFLLGQQGFQVAFQTVGVVPGLGFGQAVVPAGKGNGYAGQQHGFGPQQAFDFGDVVVGAFEVADIGPDAQGGAAIFGGAFAGFDQGLDHVAAGKGDAVFAPFAAHGHFEAAGEGVGYGYAHAVQAAGEGISAVAAGFIEFAAGMQAGEHQLDHGHVFFGMQTHGNAAPVVGHGKRTVFVDFHIDAAGEAAEGFIGSVVDGFLADVGRAVGTGVHAGAFFHRLQAFEDFDAAF